MLYICKLFIMYLLFISFLLVHLSWLHFFILSFFLFLSSFPFSLLSTLLLFHNPSHLISSYSFSFLLTISFLSSSLSFFLSFPFFFLSFHHLLSSLLLLSSPSLSNRNESRPWKIWPSHPQHENSERNDGIAWFFKTFTRRIRWHESDCKENQSLRCVSNTVRYTCTSVR